jgi:hypothetical protein
MCPICPSDVDLSCQSDVKNCLMSEMCQSEALICQKAPKFDRSICQCCHICQNWQDSEKNVHPTYALMPWSVKLDTCQSRLTIFGWFWQSAHPNCWFTGDERFHSSFPPLPLTQFFWGVCSKAPLSLYSQKARIPGLRECVGVIIPNPCTLNGTFHRDLNTLPVLRVA